MKNLMKYLLMVNGIISFGTMAICQTTTSGNNPSLLTDYLGWNASPSIN